ncbi:MAG: hypothetical protein AUF79_02250 [Crenarchaeota archaeon 13_1_20CM_2_51_8]|nr:MAG: hypothetical protein AUF79_02250 [Crenarchaeota archaeon 13_1_20CM_2_51_8]
MNHSGNRIAKINTVSSRVSVKPIFNTIGLLDPFHVNLPYLLEVWVVGEDHVRPEFYRGCGNDRVCEGQLVSRYLVSMVGFQ